MKARAPTLVVGTGDRGLSVLSLLFVLYGRALPLPPYWAQDRQTEVREAWDRTGDQTDVLIL